MPDNNFDTIYLLQLQHSYFDRVIDRMETIDEYVAASSHYFVDNRNFDPGNDISTNLIIGSTTANAITFNGNYLLVTGSRVEQIDGVNTTITFIVSRWWVTDQKRTRNGQYSLSLKRDVIADHLEIVETAPCFIEKAKIRDLSNPLIFNKEDMQFNQIKKDEILLKDASKMSWIVGYIDRSYAGSTWNSTYDVVQDYTDATLPTVNSVKVAPGTYKTAKNIRLNLYYHTPADINSSYGYHSKSYIVFDDDTFSNYQMHYEPLEKTKWNTSIKNVYNSNGYLNTYLKLVGDKIVANNIDNSVENGFRLLDLNYQNYAFSDEFNEVIALDGKVLHDGNENKYYKISVQVSYEMQVIDVTSYSNFGTAINTAIRKPVQDELCTLTNDYSSVSGYTKMSFDMYSAVVVFNEFQPETVKIKISSSRNHLNDAPYDMFAIPFTSEYKGGPISEDNFIPYAITSYIDVSDWQGFQLSKQSALHIAQSIIAELGGGGGSSYIYDVQVLPYCPIPAAIKTKEIYDEDAEYQNYQPVIYLPNLANGESVDYDIIKNSTETKNLGVILWATESTFSVDLNYDIICENPKIDFETKMYRLVSPNYSGMFEFSPAMNGGVNFFNIDATYKPYQPYIHVNPNFKFLYGSDFNDNRGLICGGDFSLSMVDDKWANFENNNKNYQLIFDREVQNMEFTRKQERIGEGFSLVSGTVAGAVQGAQIGGAAGAAIGGLASYAGGMADILMSESRYKEQLSLKKDLYGYNLGNIRALPSSITKATSLNANFKFWPFLEVYECSEIEKEALELKLQYDGMTIMKIGQIADYIVSSEKTFIKGEIIRLPNLPEAADVAYEIYNEIKKGVYI